MRGLPQQSRDEALDCLRETKVSLILLDLNMPNMDVTKGELPTESVIALVTRALAIGDAPRDPPTATSPDSTKAAAS